MTTTASHRVVEQPFENAHLAWVYRLAKPPSPRWWLFLRFDDDEEVAPQVTLAPKELRSESAFSDACLTQLGRWPIVKSAFSGGNWPRFIAMITDVTANDDGLWPDGR